MSNHKPKDFRFEPVSLEVTLSSDERHLLIDFMDCLERHRCFRGRKGQVQFLLDMSILKRKEAWPDFMREGEWLCYQVLACLENKLSDIVR